MGSEQQFCLRWNNHQSTLVAVFDTLLESGTLVDCTLAAEGQYLKAHKVVLSACSPYFELLLSQHYEKHPIVILKDVKFQELKAMMDYMYRGEVNISQDQLGALLKAAESLQIKGLSDSGGGGTEREVEPKRRKESVPAPPPPARTPPILQHSSSGLTIEHRRTAQPSQVPQVIDLPEDAPPPMSMQKMATTREGSISPVSRKRKKHRRQSSCDENSLGASGVLPSTDNHEASSSCELPPQSQVPPAPSIPATITPVTSTPIPKPSLDNQLSHTTEEKNSDSEMMSKPLASVQGAVASPQTMPIEPEPVVHKVEPQTEPLLEPKSEYLEEVNDDSVEDLTLDDDMDDMDQPRAGPSHGGEGSSSQGTGFAPWHVTATDRSTDEVFMAAQEAVGAHRDSQGFQVQKSNAVFCQVGTEDNYLSSVNSITFDVDIKSEIEEDIKTWKGLPVVESNGILCPVDSKDNYLTSVSNNTVDADIQSETEEDIKIWESLRISPIFEKAKKMREIVAEIQEADYKNFRIFPCSESTTAGGSSHTSSIPYVSHDYQVNINNRSPRKKENQRLHRAPATSATALRRSPRIKKQP